MADSFLSNDLSMKELVTLMCHNPATLYRIEKRGFIREGYHADLVLVEHHVHKLITNEETFYKCGWTPYDGMALRTQVTHTFVNGNLVYENGQFNEGSRGERLRFQG